MTSNTPKTFTTTTPTNPLGLKHRRKKNPWITPSCYTKVTVETPGHARIKNHEDSCDEVRNLTVAVRIRPFNTRELNAIGSTNVIKIENKTVLVKSSTSINHEFKYDHVYWSCSKEHVDYSSQEDVFVGIGQPLLENAFRGYNACLFAYGQTGSGKSYSMMGPDVGRSDFGIIPRFCKQLFTKISLLDPKCTATVDVSYFEIYNEKIHDLLLTSSLKDQHTPLRVREHPDWGPYVVNLSTHPVKTYEEMCEWLRLGNENRATAATAMNEKSSRSHSIFSVELSILDGSTEGDPGRRSKVSLVDLAGSERLGNMNSNDEKLKQGVSINKSLLTLGKVICALADQRKGHQFVPYRESVLTWLLRESLGGNSLTCMLATISPASANIEETLATLRYACKARSIINRARINEEPHDRLIRELRSEVERLKALSQECEKTPFMSSILQTESSMDSSQEVEELKKKLTDKEAELTKAQQTWENRYKESHEQQLQELVEFQRKKEELESRVRIMSNLNEDVNVSVFETNFLEEVENILVFDSHRGIDNFVETFRNILHENGFNYKISHESSLLNILDSENKQRTVCNIGDVRERVERGDDMVDFIKDLKWERSERKLTKQDVNTAMSEIYQIAQFLKPHIDNEEKLRLAFAKFIKSTQALETALRNNVNELKQKKAVTFRL